MGDNSGTSGYAMADDWNEFSESANDKWDKGYDLVDIEYTDNGKIVGVFGDYIGYGGGYFSSDSLTGFKEEIGKKFEDGFDLTGVEYVEDTWVGVYRPDSYRISAYSVGNSEEEFREKLDIRTEQGFDLVDIEQTGDTWFGIYEKPSSFISEEQELGDRHTVNMAHLDLIFADF